METSKVLLRSLLVSVLLLTAMGRLVLAAPSEPPSSDEKAGSQRFSISLRTYADAENVELLDQIGGKSVDVAVVGIYAYVGKGLRLVILDISTPSNPVMVGRTDLLTHTIKAVTVSGHHAYVALGNAGLRIFDVSDPKHPTETGHYQPATAVDDVMVEGETAYLVIGSSSSGDQDGLQMLDVGDPAHPAEIGVYYPEQSMAGVEVSEGIAYIMVADGLKIIDVSDPTNPNEIGFHSYSASIGISRLAAVSADIAYIVDAYLGHLIFVDVSDPANPIELGTYAYSNAFFAGDVAVDGQTMYVICRQTGLHVVDISDLSNPIDVGLYEVWEAERMTVSDNIAYVIVGGVGPRLIDVSNASSPTQVGIYDEAAGIGYDVEIEDDTAYVAAGKHLWMIDIDDPSALDEIGHYKSSNPSWYFPSMYDVEVSGEIAYLADRGLYVVDVSNPSQPVELGSYDNEGGYTLALNENLAYLDAGNSLQIIDMSDLNQPDQRGEYSTDCTVKDIYVQADIAYVLGFDGVVVRLYIVDVSDPTSPTELGVLDFSYGYWPPYPPNPVGVSVRGNKAYVAAGSLYIADVSVPSNPTEIGFYDTPGLAQGVCVDDVLAYVADGDSGLRVVDVSDPSNPTEIGFFDTFGSASRVTTNGEEIYVADELGGLVSLRYTTYVVSGHVRGSGGVPMEGVTISSSADISTTTNPLGTYTIPDLRSSTYVITPTNSGWTFIPLTRTVSVPPDATGQDFTMLHPPVSTTLNLSGTVSQLDTLTYVDTQGLTTTVTFPAGAANITTTFVLTPTVVSDYVDLAFAGHAFELEAYQNGIHQPDFTFEKPVTVTIHYSERDSRLISDKAQLKLYWHDGNIWRDAAATCTPTSSYIRDEIDKVLSVPICHLSRFALFGPTHRVYLPLVLRNH
jgi:hypothetical protein